MLTAFRRSLSRLALLALAGLPAATPLAAQIGPDLTPTRVTAPTAAILGDTIEISIVVANAGIRDVSPY